MCKKGLDFLFYTKIMGYKPMPVKSNNGKKSPDKKPTDEVIVKVCGIAAVITIISLFYIYLLTTLK